MTGFVGSVLIGSVGNRIALLADDPPAQIDPTTGKGPEWGKAAPIGLLIILLMGIALYFLIKSMNKNLRKVPSSFETFETDGVPDQEDVDGAGFVPGDGAGPDPADPLAGTAADHADHAEGPRRG